MRKTLFGILGFWFVAVMVVGLGLRVVVFLFPESSAATGSSLLRS